MAYRQGLLNRIFVNFKNSIFAVKKADRFVGSDQYGNKYFERHADNAHNLRASRYIQERKEFDTDDTPEVPVEWNAWLRGMRKDPPTPEEIEQNYITMMKTKLRAAELDKKFSVKEPRGSSTGPSVAEDIESNLQHVPFPKRDDLESTPGQFSSQIK